jgi:outer membrane protein TolC
LRIDEAKGRLLGAGRLSNPEVEFEFSQNPRMPERSFALTWMQKFPVTARLRIEKAVSRAELAAAEAEVRNAERKLAGDVQIAAVKLLTLDRVRQVRGQQIVNSDELSGFMSRRVSTGEASIVDVGQVELESKQLATQLLQLDVEQAALLGELRLLLGMSPTAPLSIKGELAEPGAIPSLTPILGKRGDYRAAHAELEAAQHSVALAKANKWEDIGVGLTAEHERAEDAPEGFERDTMLGFKVNVPLPLWNKNEGKIAEATASAQRAKKEIDAIAAQIRSEVSIARAEMAALAGVIEQTDSKLLPQARQIEDQLRSAYQIGQTTLPEVIRARGRRFELEAQRLDALRGYHLARARHRTALGAASTPQRDFK